MPDTPTSPPDTPVAPSPGDVIRSLGYDPDQIQSLVVTPTHVVAVAADYPDPHAREVSDGAR